MPLVCTFSASAQYKSMRISNKALDYLPPNTDIRTRVGHRPRYISTSNDWGVALFITHFVYLRSWPVRDK